MRPDARHANGFILPAAIFLLVLVASISALMLRFTVNAQQSTAFDVLGARVYQAGRFGLEVALYNANRVPTTVCNGSNNSVTAPPGFEGITITWTCTASGPFNETGDVANDYFVWQLVATARIGNVGQPGYVERQFQATVVNP